MDVIAGRDVAIPCGDITLEGLLHTPDGTAPFAGIIVCHPHPQYGGDMYNSVVGALVRAALDSGFAALRFNFRAVGESEGTHTGGQAEPDDVKAACTFLAEQPEIDSGRVALAGYSFGAAMALVAAPDIGPAGLALVSLPTIAGALSPPDGAFPLLLVSGDRDEYSDTAALARLAEAAGGRARLEVIPGVDHFWAGADDRLTETTAAFLRTL
ncbi:MAG: prolyl oligopeptidase family serine peptidase [Chloroflexi bacterium]|nr:prolyl oligopeptidase family serine peptidase [Chloroflexota bacterium]MCI0783077.1 prolyl oligopeptidase family serine peptidase [Chloroflexota bacterium]MCI0814708.1 prolyl oligopeptidase family serine peptidase [Chloroflexota bacterium]MCI0816819.1 prolyl oligopeptidase family serine peptidase [Chloroflexota bacterium]MCI0819017.1 prolyl oligopeptidase family serine peptidase [Chloroflexota bacterium]